MASSATDPSSSPSLLYERVPLIEHVVGGAEADLSSFLAPPQPPGPCEVLRVAAERSLGCQDASVAASERAPEPGQIFASPDGHLLAVLEPGDARRVVLLGASRGGFAAPLGVFAPPALLVDGAGGGVEGDDVDASDQQQQQQQQQGVPDVVVACCWLPCPPAAPDADADNAAATTTASLQPQGSRALLKSALSAAASLSVVDPLIGAAHGGDLLDEADSSAALVSAALVGGGGGGGSGLESQRSAATPGTTAAGAGPSGCDCGVPVVCGGACPDRGQAVGDADPWPAVADLRLGRPPRRT